VAGTSTANQRLDSWKAIADYIGRDVRTAIRWEKQRGLPVRRIPGSGRQVVFAYPHEIDAWLRGDIASAPPGGKNPEVIYSELPQLRPVVENEDSSNVPLRTPRRVATKNVAVISTSILAVLVVGTIVLAAGFATKVKVTVEAESQITNDNTAKIGLVTDGAQVFFGEARNGRTRLVAVPADGGTLREIPTPFIRVAPEDISPDRRELLVLAWEAEGEVDRALWTVPLDGTPPRRVGTVICHSAAWSPDGRRIAFAQGQAVYLTTESGDPVRRIQTFTTIPVTLRWSLDGKRLQFQLQNPSNESASFWEIQFVKADAPEVASLEPLHIALNGSASASTVLNNAGSAFLGEGGSAGRVLFLDGPGTWWRRSFDLTEVATRSGSVGSIAVDPSSHRFFLIGHHSGSFELESFDRTSGEFRPFLPGISALHVDFSRDGGRIAFVREPDNTLWISRLDGSFAHQIITPAFEDLELPRWSPDGKQIAFMARIPGRTYRIFIVPAAGGEIRQASTTADNQGAPTWSPDGKWLAYGNVLCQEAAACAIHRIEVATGRQLTLPGSEGLETARWSPDGRFIAALKPERHEVYVFELRTGEWRKVAVGITGNDLAWSEDSRGLYASRPLGDRPAVVRVSLADGKIVSAVDLSDFSRLAGQINTWFTLAPNNSIIFLRLIQSDEIYSFTYRYR